MWNSKALKVVALVPVVCLCLTSTSWAGKEDDPKGPFDHFKDALTKGNYQNVTMEALEEILKVVVMGYIEKGLPGKANKLKRGWFNVKSESRKRGRGIGEYEPLAPWLNDLYDDVAKYLGPDFIEENRVYDVITLNYTVPVVYQPKGDIRNDDTWPKSDYVEHFVAYASVGTYWAAMGGCKAAQSQVPLSDEQCLELAKAAEKEVKSKYAAEQGAWVYDQAHKSKKKKKKKK